MKLFTTKSKSKNSKLQSVELVGKLNGGGYANANRLSITNVVRTITAFNRWINYRLELLNQQQIVRLSLMIKTVQF